MVIMMHVIENHNQAAGKTYCYVGECKWDKELKEYKTPRKAVGRIEGTPPTFIPNKHFESLLVFYLSSGHIFSQAKQISVL
jgi:hypothetical protein